MNAKKSLATLLLGASALAFAQEEPKPLIQADVLKNVDINLLLRGGYESPFTDAAGTSGTTKNLNGFKLNEARFEVRGKIVPNLEFRMRTRLHKADGIRTLDNSTSNLDHANITYKFGEKKNWAITVGKQNNMMGSWEFDKNPTYEYQYSNVVGGYNNLFGMGARLAYSPNANNTFTAQAMNTSNDAFATITNGYDLKGNQRARTPLLYQLVWQGNFFNKAWQTWYSVGTSEFARNKQNFQVALGNQVTIGKFQAYLDLLTTNLAFDHNTGITGEAYNAYYKSHGGVGKVFAEDVNIKSAVLRLDYEVLPQWFVTAKGFYETASARKDDVLGKNFRTNKGYLLGLEYQPVKKQNMKFFAYYYGNQVDYSKAIPSSVKPVYSNMFAIGALYFVNVL